VSLARGAQRPAAQAVPGVRIPPLRFIKPSIVCRDPVDEAGFLRVSGEFGGKPGANSRLWALDRQASP
jgi:hypothetical protein